MKRLLALVPTAAIVVAPASSSGPPNSNSLWYTSPGSADNWSLTALPISNGYVAALTTGNTAGNDSVLLNLESAWSGGPFQPGINYTGGNPSTPIQQSVWDDYRKAIWQSANGTIPDINSLMEDIIGYGSFAGPGTLNIISKNGSAAASNYVRFLDLEHGVSGTQWTEGGIQLERDYLCSNPSKVCLVHQQSSTTGRSNNLAYSVAFTPLAPTVTNITCAKGTTDLSPILTVRGIVPADPVSAVGMSYEIQIKVFTSPSGIATCEVGSNRAFQEISVPSTAAAYTVVFTGNTDFSSAAGDAAHGYSFKGSDPHAWVTQTLGGAVSSTFSDAQTVYTSIRAGHDKDYAAFNDFKLTLDSIGNSTSAVIPTDQEVTNYAYNTGNRHLEVLLFNYGRYMLFTASRSLLPLNLMGKWGPTVENPWSGDYHSNINIQMNYWSALTTFPSNPEIQASLFDYIQTNWVSRGAETASVVYGIERGWVAHDEMNLFGYTGMKAGNAQWANYPQSAVWMMIHVWDQFDYFLDKQWLIDVGWPLLKGVAQFHLDLLVEDGKFNDGTLVTAPCNSPEQLPTTFGCSHAQQITFQLFNAIEKGYSLAGDNDEAFLNEVKEAKSKLWMGFKVGSWGQFQEWKMDLDSPTDTHRHLSHLIGLYPGYAIASYSDAAPIANYSRQQVLDAVRVSLVARGNGTGPDADSGWEKMWRAACWAQLGNADEFFLELSYGISVNYGPNLFSQYSPGSTTFQIDANLGYPGAVMNALVQAPDTPSFAEPLNITLLPALPSQWPQGSITNTRLRGGLLLDLAWSSGKMTHASLSVDRDVLVPRKVNVIYNGAVVDSFTTAKGLTRSIGA